MKKYDGIKTVGVVGAGTMGSAIAQHFLMKGLPVVLVDLNAQSLARGKELILTSLAEAAERKIIKLEDKAKIEARLQSSTELNALSSCQLIIEAVFEDFKVKNELFKTLETIVSDDCILASNTSSFAIRDLASGLKYPGRFLGVHYFYHAAKNKLVEIIPGDKTSHDFVDVLEKFYAYYDKLPIIVKDVAGFAVNRFFVPWLNEAARLYEEKLGSPAFIDEVAKETFAIGMGPFALMNATGVPIAYHAAQNLAEKFGPFYAAANGLKKQTDSKMPWNIDAAYSGKNDKTTIRDRLLGAALGVAAQMVSEGVTDVTSCDLAARVGLRWTEGPFELGGKIGWEKVRTSVTTLFSKWNQPLPQILSDVTVDQLLPKDVLATIKNKVGYIEFNRPDTMNALNERVMAQLDRAVTEWADNATIEKIIFVGKGKAFVAGADIKFFIKNIEDKNLGRIYDFTAFGQQVLKKIAGCKKTTVAYLDGLTLGGGLELALACQYRVATPRAMLAFPETGIGIYPGLGGTQRTTRLIGKGLAKFVVATGQMMTAQLAKKIGLVDQLVDRYGDLGELASLVIKKEPRTETMVEEKFVDFGGEISPQFFNHEELKKYEAILARKAPIALKKAMELIDQGESLSLDEALGLELKGLDSIFSTQDAYTGLKSVINRDKPKYIGA